VAGQLLNRNRLRKRTSLLQRGSLFRPLLISRPLVRGDLVEGAPRGASSFQRLPHALRDHGRIVVDCERHGALKSMRARHEDADSAVNGSAAIHASSVPLAYLPPATTAASMRSRRSPGTPLMSKTVSGIRHDCSEHRVVRTIGRILVRGDLFESPPLRVQAHVRVLGKHGERDVAGDAHDHLVAGTRFPKATGRSCRFRP
jgi:hypothetical protein